MNTLHTTRAALATVAEFIKQRPGFNACNYNSAAGYSADRRRAAKQLADARAWLERADNTAGMLERAGKLTADKLAAAINAANGAGWGRFTLNATDAGGWDADYCCGQYWPTEYRNGAARWAEQFYKALTA